MIISAQSRLITELFGEVVHEVKRNRDRCSFQRSLFAMRSILLGSSCFGFHQRLCHGSDEYAYLGR